MITVEFKDFDEMMGFAQRLAGLGRNGDSITPAPTSVPVLTGAQPGAAGPVQQAPVQPPAQGMPTQQTPFQPPVMTGVPTSAPSYTPDDLARAAMTLMDSGRQQELIELLQSFGVSSLPDLRPDQYGAFATALRGMGAQI